MAILNPDSPFQSWVLSPQELAQGSILTRLQKQVIQNQIAQVAAQKINLEFTPDNPLKFAQEEAALKGQMQALEYLLQLSQSSEAQNDPGNQNVTIVDQKFNPQE